MQREQSAARERSATSNLDSGVTRNEKHPHLLRRSPSPLTSSRLASSRHASPRLVLPCLASRRAAPRRAAPRFASDKTRCRRPRRITPRTHPSRALQTFERTTRRREKNHSRHHSVALSRTSNFTTIVKYCPWFLTEFKD